MDAAAAVGTAKREGPAVQMGLEVSMDPGILMVRGVLMAPEVSTDTGVSTAGTSRMRRMSAARTISLGDVAREPCAVTGMKKAFLTMAARSSTTSERLQASEVAVINL
ncbi:hypothetical protein BJF95_18650 [Rhizobium oryziradicis]|uniref:Uncharacterized protein n=1 Tax=Rhizobium oryziradicis TaxID=1867956 RepID=A0A1Q8ZTW6_9HYPH|nr:hypothetical protein BJF95_18650 [Rhizobium oryziradicis]